MKLSDFSILLLVLTLAALGMWSLLSTFLAEPNEFLEQCRDSVSTISKEAKIGKYLAYGGIVAVLLALIGLGGK